MMTEREPERLTEMVWFSHGKIDDRRPTFHHAADEFTLVDRRYGEVGDVQLCVEQDLLTRCGVTQVTFYFDACKNHWPSVEHGIYLPIKHAALFGRPCRRCFPGGVTYTYDGRKVVLTHGDG